MTDFSAWLARHPWLTVVAVAALSLAALLVCLDPLTGKPRIGIDATSERLLPPSSEDRAVFDRTRALFGETEAVLVAVTLDSVFTAENVERIARLTERFRELPGVDRVFSLATAPNLLTAGDDIDVRTFAQQVEQEPGRLGEFRAQLERNPVYAGSLVSADGRTAAFAISLSGVDEPAYIAAGYEARIREIVRDMAGDAPVWITGNPVVKAATTGALLDTLLFTIPLIFGLMALVLLAAFRSARATLVCIVAVAIALLWTLATVVMLGLTLNLVTAIVPPLVLTIGLTYTIHVLSEYLRHERAAAEDAAEGLRRAVAPLGIPAVDRGFGLLSRLSHVFFGREPSATERALRTMNHIAAPVGLSFVTAVIGFLGFMVSPLPAIREFGMLSIAGVGYAALLALVFIPALLSVTGSSQRRALPGDALFERLASRLAEFDLKRRVPILVIGVALIPLGLWLATDIRAGSEYIEDFPESSEQRRDYEAINRAFNGANVLSILIETHVNDALTDPALAREIGLLQGWLRQQPEVGAAVSYVDFLKLTRQSLNQNDPAYFSVPDSAGEIKQILVFGGNEELQRFLDARLRSTQINVRINVDSTIAVADLVQRIERQLAQLPPPLNGRVTGSAVLAAKTVGDLVEGQGWSIGIAVAGIWLLLAMLFTSWRAGLLALLPTVIPVAVYFGTLGLLDINLSPTTSLVACIVLGVTVDETFHFLTRFNSDARGQGSEVNAAKSALSSVMRPITLNMIALGLGFLAFTTGSLHSQALFGLLAAFTLFVAWIMDITFTPALGSYLRIVTLWDLLRLDLGRSPQHTIPLLAGLSNREARVFALMSRMERYEPGARVIRHGDPSRDMYVILDGELEAWVDRDGARRSLATMGRGTTLGETGFFGQKRTANVDTLTKSRLLRFDSQDLERLKTRYPRIAASVFRNLNRIQAERLARTTAMLQ